MARDSLGVGLRKLIFDDFAKGMKQTEIRKKYKLEKSKVSRLFKKFKTSSTLMVNHKGGRPRSTSSREDSLITRAVRKDPFKSSVRVKEELNLSVSDRTVRSRMMEAGLLSRRPAKKPLISTKNRMKRLCFAKEHVHWTVANWKNVLFSDESKFNIFGTDGIAHVRRPKDKRLNSRYCLKTVKHGGGGVMVWGAFSAQGTGPLHQINGIMDSLMYRDIMADVMYPYAEWNMPLKFIFQQDNDPKHTSKVVKSWFLQNKINVMEWPAQSPDLNPIENLWDIVDRKINRENVRNKDQLYEEIKKTWEEIPKQIIDNLIGSMPRRCKAVIDNNGFATKY